MEKIKESAIHPQAVKKAPGSCFRSVVFPAAPRFGRNLYTKSQKKCQQRKRKINTQLNNLMNHLA